MTQIVFLVKITLITEMGNNMQPASLMPPDFLAFFFCVLQGYYQLML